MGHAMEDTVRLGQQSLSSALAGAGQRGDVEPGASLWDGSGGGGGAMGQYNPLVGSTADERAAKKQVAAKNGSGEAEASVV